MDFDSISCNVHLIEFLTARYNYVIDTQKSSHIGYTVLKNSIDTILVKFATEGNFSNKWFYLNADNKTDYGTIIHYIAKRENLNLKQKSDLAILSNILNQASTVFHYTPVPIPKTEQINKFNSKATVLQDRSFLYFRGISDDVLNHPFITGKVLNKWAKDTNTEAFYLNTVFPFTSEITPGFTISTESVELAQVTGFEIKNKNFGSNSMAAFSNKSNSLWFSNINQSIDAFYLFESGVDALSYFQLNYVSLKDKKVLFSSYGGDLAVKQLALISSIASNVIEVHLCADNDQAGSIHNCKILIELIKQYQTIELITTNTEYIIKTNDISGINKLFKSSLFQTTNISEYFNISTPKTPENATILQSLLCSLLNDLDLFRTTIINTPLLKDFNDDLLEHLKRSKTPRTQAQARNFNQIQ